MMNPRPFTSLSLSLPLFLSLPISSISRPLPHDMYPFCQL